MSGRIAGMLVGILWGAMLSPAAAQSLGDVARQEATRREQIKAPAKVFTNADLPTPSDDEVTSTAADASAAAGTDGAKPAAGARSDAAPTAAKPDATPKDDEAGWRTRAGQINGKLAEARAAARLLKALSDRLGLEMQAANPQIAARAATEREQVRNQLAEALAKETAAREAQLAFEQEARAAGVPPTWIQ